MTKNINNRLFRAGFETCLTDWAHGSTFEDLARRPQDFDNRDWALGFWAGLDYLKGWVTTWTDHARDLDLPEKFKACHPSIAHRI